MSVFLLCVGNEQVHERISIMYMFWCALSPLHGACFHLGSQIWNLGRGKAGVLGEGKLGGEAGRLREEDGGFWGEFTSLLWKVCGCVSAFF